MLISMPTGTSMIFGALQAIWLSFLEPDEFRPAYKVLPNEEFASEIFFPQVPAGILLHRERRCLAGGKMLQKRRLSTASEPPAGDERPSKVRRRAISLQIKNL
jgi:hypothetical protein